MEVPGQTPSQAHNTLTQATHRKGWQQIAQVERADEYVLCIQRPCLPEHRAFGTVRAYWQADMRTWQFWAGHYDMTRDAALLDMIKR